jgi:hypothetical protein
MPAKPFILLHARRMNLAGISAIWGRSTLRSRVHSSRSNSARSSARSSLLSRGRRRFTIANGSWLLRRAFGFAFCCAARQSSANAFPPTLLPTLQIGLQLPTHRLPPPPNPHRNLLAGASHRRPVRALIEPRHTNMDMLRKLPRRQDGPVAHKGLSNPLLVKFYCRPLD